MDRAACGGRLAAATLDRLQHAALRTGAPGAGLIRISSGIWIPSIPFNSLTAQFIPFNSIPAQSKVMYDALREKGLTTALVMFEGEQHGFRQAANIR